MNIDTSFNSIFYEYIGIENSEINNGRSYYIKYRSIDDTHVFLGEPLFYKGIVKYKGQVYKTKLQYDVLNDLIIIKYIDETHAFSLSLTPELIEKVTFNQLSFVRLPRKKELNSIYKNGLFEEVMVGDSFNFYIKHSKEPQKKLTNRLVQYSFKPIIIFILEYDGHFYEIKNKKNLVKVLPQYRKIIKNFYKKKRKINKESLEHIFKQLDKLTTHESN